MDKQQFTEWFDTFIEEKGIDLEEAFTVEGESGTNFMTVGMVVEAIKSAPIAEQQAIKSMIVRLDFANQPIVPYFKHLAQAIAI